MFKALTEQSLNWSIFKTYYWFSWVDHAMCNTVYQPAWPLIPIDYHVWELLLPPHVEVGGTIPTFTGPWYGSWNQRNWFLEVSIKLLSHKALSNVDHIYLTVVNQLFSQIWIIFVSQTWIFPWQKLFRQYFLFSIPNQGFHIILVGLI